MPAKQGTQSLAVPNAMPLFSRHGHLSVAAVVAFAWADWSQQQPCDVFCHSRLAARAEAAGNVAEYGSHIRAVVAIAPSHPGVVYAMARAFALAGASDSAVAWLDRLGHMGDTRDPAADSVFRGIRARPGYADARNRLLANRLPILDGKVAFEIADPDFLPEGIAYDSVRGRFLMGSLVHRAVASFAPNGTPTTIVPHAPDMLRVVGVHVDTRRNRLWFATWAPDSMAPADSTERPSVTRLFLADLTSGRVVKSWVPDGGRPGHLLNDLAVTEDGTLFITDSDQGSIYRLASPQDTLELFLQPDPVRYSVANGVTSAPGGQVLYVAFLQGIARVDVGSRSIALVPSPDTVSTASIDGLYWYRGSLMGVQGIPSLERVVRYSLSADGRGITAGAVLERGHPVVVQPTTGTIAGSRFYYIANSQYGRLDNNTSKFSPQTGSPVRTAVRVIELRP
jgi:sugar lactone lactonase YvrE